MRRSLSSATDIPLGFGPRRLTLALTMTASRYISGVNITSVSNLSFSPPKIAAKPLRSIRSMKWLMPEWSNTGSSMVRKPNHLWARFSEMAEHNLRKEAMLEANRPAAPLPSHQDGSPVGPSRGSSNLPVARPAWQSPALIDPDQRLVGINGWLGSSGGWDHQVVGIIRWLGSSGGWDHQVVGIIRWLGSSGGWDHQVVGIIRWLGSSGGWDHQVVGIIRWLGSSGGWDHQVVGIIRWLGSSGGWDHQVVGIIRWLGSMKSRNCLVVNWNTVESLRD